MPWFLLSTAQSRARVSFKRRPPTRQHRRSIGEDATVSASELDKPQENGVEEAVFEAGDGGLAANPEEAEGRDCENTEGDGAKDGSSGDLQEEQKAEPGMNLKTLEEEEQQTSECGPAKPAEGAVVTVEGQEKQD